MDGAKRCDGGARRTSDNKQTRSKRTGPMRVYEDAFSISLSAFFAAFLASRRSSFSARRAAFCARVVGESLWIAGEARESGVAGVCADVERAEVEVEGAREDDDEAEARAASDFRSLFAARRSSFVCVVVGVDVPERVADRDSASTLDVASSIDGRSFSFSRLPLLLACFSAFRAAFSSFLAFFAAFSASRSALDPRLSCFDSPLFRFRFLHGSSAPFPFPFDVSTSSSSPEPLSTDPRKNPL